jgi:hypothetical protein
LSPLRQSKQELKVFQTSNIRPALALPTFIRLNRINFPRSNPLAFFVPPSVTKMKNFETYFFFFVTDFSVCPQNLFVCLEVSLRLRPYQHTLDQPDSNFTGKNTLAYYYNKMSFLVQIKFITEDSNQTHIQILILNKN